MEDIKLIYDNNNEEIIIINYFTSLVEKKNKEKGEFIIENNILKINWENKIFQEFIKNEDQNNDEIYVYNQISANEFNNESEYIYINHLNWNDKCIIKKDKIYRLTNENEIGKYRFIDNLLIIYWENWDYEIFLIHNNIYKFINLNFKVYHPDWVDFCFLKEDLIIRKNNENEYGSYKLDLNSLIINWHNWEPDLFIKLNNDYIHEKLIKYIEYNNLKYICYENKLFENFNEVGFIYYKDNNIITIDWLNNESVNYYYQIYKNNLIKLFNNINNEIILVKDYEIKININLLTFEVIDNRRKGIFSFEDKQNKLIINWENENNIEKYICLDNKYYIDEYYELNNKEIILIYDNQKINLKINIFENYFFTEDKIKIPYLKCNDIYFLILNNNINKFHLKNIYNQNLLVNENLYFKLKNIKNNNYDFESYIDLLNNLKKSTSSLYILYDNFNKNNKSIDSLINYTKIYENLIFIINIELSDNLDDILEHIPKKSNIIINLKKDIDIKFLKNNFKNLIITRSYNLNNFYIIKNLLDILLNNKYLNNNNYNIFYINNNNLIEENLLDISNYKNKTIYYNYKKRYLNHEYNYLYDLLFLTNNYNEIIIIFIFYYILYKNIYDLFNSNFIVNLELLIKLVDNKFNKYINYLD